MATTQKVQAKYGQYDAQALQEAFRQGGAFSWSKWYQEGTFEAVKALIKPLHGVVTTDVTREGKCIDCGARMSVGDVVLLIPNLTKGYDTVVLIEHYRDHNH